VNSSLNLKKTALVALTLLSLFTMFSSFPMYFEENVAHATGSWLSGYEYGQDITTTPTTMTTSTAPSIRSHFSINNRLNYTSKSSNSYTSFYDGYMWVATSGYAGGGGGYNCLYKYNATTMKLLGNVTPPTKWSEAYSPYVYGGVVYVVGWEYPDSVVTGFVDTYNESTLAPIHNYIMAYNETISTNIVSAIYDPLQNVMLFDLSIGPCKSNNIWILKCPPSEITNNADYVGVTITNNAYITNETGYETHTVLFKNSVYTLVMAIAGTPQNYHDEMVFNSSSLTTWSGPLFQVYAQGNFFSHITSNSNWIACGLISNDTTGINTYRIEYWPGTGSWLQYDTGLTVRRGENHPNVNMLDSNTVLFEESSRDGGVNPVFYTFNCASGVLNYQFTDTNRTGFSDRIVMVDTYAYVSDNHATNESDSETLQLVNTTSLVLEISVPSATTDVGLTVNFAALAMGGTLPYGYQWYINGNPVTGATGLAYAFSSTTSGTYNIYSTVQDNNSTQATSNSITMTVNSKPSITNFTATPLSSGLLYSDTEAFVSVSCSGDSGSYSYDWVLNGESMANTTFPRWTYYFNKMGQQQISVRITDDAGYIVQSNTVTLNYSYNLLLFGLIGGLIVAVAAVVVILRRGKKH